MAYAPGRICAGAGTRDDISRGHREAMAHVLAPRRERPPRHGTTWADQQQNAKQQLNVVGAR
jgi:hypothetical protein